MKIGIWVEGFTDSAFFPTIAKRILGEEHEQVIRDRRGGCIHQMHIGLPKAIKEFSIHNCSHILICADNHRTSPGLAAKKKSDAIAMTMGKPTIVAVALESLEAWMLADYVCLSRILNIPNINKPPKVEGISDPKNYLKSVCGTYPTNQQIVEIASSMSLEVRREVPSFDLFLRDLDGWL
ncbi:MAG: DUF4276 family protein [Planctomycetota bacterium]|nr:DUF4276 family protein [Planctomycetota bacterium]